jgi:nucleoside-diphosphate-sugar epimerase
MSNTILFGPSGFLGPAILKKYPKIIAVGRNKPPYYCKNKFIKINDIHNLKKLDSIKISKVIYLVGNSNHHTLNQSKLETALEYNFYPLKSALNYFSKRKIKKFITFSGALLYDEKRLKVPCKESTPLNPQKNNYIFSKYLAEKLTEAYSALVPCINVRLSNIYGPSLLTRPDIIISILEKILKKKRVKIKSFKPRRDFIHVNDVADGIIALINSKYHGHVNLGSGHHSSIKDVSKIIEKLTQEKITSNNQKVSGPYIYSHDISLIKKVTDWKPRINLNKGLEMTWFQMLKWTSKK